MQELENEIEYKKEGFASQSVGAIVTLIVGVGVATLVLIFVGTLGGQTYNVAESNIIEIGNKSVSEEAITGVTDSITNSFDFTKVHSGSLSMNVNGSDVALGNFTIDYNLGTFTLASGYDVGLNNSDLTANYSHGEIQIQTAVKNSILSGFEAVEQTGDYLPLIVLAVVITLVMALVLSLGFMGGFSSGRGGSAL